MATYNYPNTSGDIIISPAALATLGITLAPGDTLNIQPGTYGLIGMGYAGSASGRVGLAGNSSNRITINFQTGAFLGTTSVSSFAYYWDNCSYVDVVGVRGDTTGGKGATLGQARGTTNNIRFINCKLSALIGTAYFWFGDTSITFDGTLGTTQWGFKFLQCDFDNVNDANAILGTGTSGTTGFVHDVEVYQCRFRNYSSGSFVAAPLNLQVCFNYRVHECLFSDIGMVTSPIGHNACVYAIGWGYVYRNTFGPNNWANDVRAFPIKKNALSLDGADAQVRFYNNITFTKRKYAAIELNSAQDGLGSGYSHTSSEVWNNTVYRTAYSSIYSPSSHIVDVFVPDVVIKNNVTIEPNQGAAYNPAGANNYIWNNSLSIDPAGVHASNNQNFQFFADSGLVDTTDWVPSPSSPLLNAGVATPAWLTVDHNGDLRSVGSFPDVGAVERQSGNVSPTANAGTNQSITLPTNSVSLTGSGADSDGTIAAYAWSKVSGPAGGSIVSPASQNTSVTGLVAGVYVFRLTVTDDGSATGFDDIQVTVNPALLSPTADAGADQVITLPTDTIVLNGNATDTDGTIESWTWSMVSFPGAANIVSPSSQNTVVSGLSAGVYVFRLTVVDDDGLTAHDDIQVTVNPATTPTSGIVYGGQPNVAIAINTIPFSGAGINSGNTSIIYEIGDVLKSYMPGRPINALTRFENGKGYYIIAIADMDLTAYISSPTA